MFAGHSLINNIEKSQYNHTFTNKKKTSTSKSYKDALSCDCLMTLQMKLKNFTTLPRK